MNTRYVFHVLVPLFLLASLSGNAQEQPLPELGDAESAVLSLHEEQALGERFLMEIRVGVRTVSDPILKNFVRVNLYGLAEHSNLKIPTLHPILIDSKELNAFAAPGGIIGVNLGMFINAEDIHEYSSVIAHELAHLSQRHFARRIARQRQTTVQNLIGFITSAAIIAGGSTEAGLATMFGAHAMIESGAFAYSRHQETEADRIGFNTLAEAGYDPMGAPRMFERLQRAYRFRADVPIFMRTHPVNEDRIAGLRSQANEIPSAEYESSNEYQLIRARVVHRFFDTASDALAHAEVLTGDSIQDKYELALALNRIKRHEEAINTMVEVIEVMPHSISAISCFADLLIDAEKPERAIALLESALSDTPDNAPLSMIYARALNALNRHEEATDVLKTQARLHSSDIDVWFQLAETAGLAKNIVELHRARAEFYALRGQYKDAIQNLQSAKKLIDGGSFRLEAGLDQRILEFREQAEIIELERRRL